MVFANSYKVLLFAIDHPFIATLLIDNPKLRGNVKE